MVYVPGVASVSAAFATAIPTWLGVADVHAAPPMLNVTALDAPATRLTAQVRFWPEIIVEGSQLMVGVRLGGGFVGTFNANEAAVKSWLSHAKAAVTAPTTARGSLVSKVIVAPLACALTGLLQFRENLAAMPEASEALVENWP